MKTKKYNKMTSLMMILILVFFAGCFATTKHMEQGDNQKSVDEKKIEVQHSDDIPKYHFVRFGSRYYNANQLSKETLQWLDKTAYLSFEEMIALNSIPDEIMELEDKRRKANNSDEGELLTNSSEFQKRFTQEQLQKMKRFAEDKSHMDKSVADLQKEIFEKFSEEELLTILRMSEIDGFTSNEEYEQTLYFMENVFLPVIADKWKRIQFESFVETEEFNKALSSYFYTSLLYEIKQPQNIKVGDMLEKKEGLKQALGNHLKTRKHFPYEDIYKKESDFVREIQEIENTWSDDALSFKFLLQGGGPEYSIYQTEQRNRHQVTSEDIKSLLALKPADSKLLLRDFHDLVKKWKSEDPDRDKRVMALVHSNSGLDVDYKFFDGDEEFILKTILLSDLEVTKEISSKNNSLAPEKLYFRRGLYPRISKYEYPAFSFAFSYAIDDFDTLTLKERDRAIFGFIKAFEEYCLEMSFEEYMEVKADQLFQKYQELAAQFSNDKIKIIVKEGAIKLLNENQESGDLAIVIYGI